MVRSSISKRRFLMAVLLLCVVAFQSAEAVAVHRNQKKSARQAVETLEEQWRQAQLHGDTGVMDRLLSDDFVGITPFGRVTTKAQELSGVKEGFIALSQLDLSDIKVKLIGPIVAVVTSRAEVTGVVDGKPINGVFRYTRVYQRVASGAWKITSFEATRDVGAKGHSETDASQALHPE